MLGVLDLPRDHRHHFKDPFLVVTCRLKDIGLVGWNDRRWSHQDKAPAKRNRKPRSKQTKTPWQQAFDADTGRYYFYNVQENLTVWEEPVEGFVPDATVQYYTDAGIAPLYSSSPQAAPASEAPATAGGSTDETAACDVQPADAVNSAAGAASAPGAGAADAAASAAADGLESTTQTAPRAEAVAAPPPAQRVQYDSHADPEAVAAVSEGSTQPENSQPRPQGQETNAVADEVAASMPPRAAHGAAPLDVPAAVRFSPAKKGDLSDDVERYWLARYSLMSRWSDGVRLDETSLFSVTPEMLAKHQAAMLAPCGVVLDAFCGSGGNAIQLALHAEKVRRGCPLCLCSTTCAADQCAAHAK
jgi:WW domain